ncbi:phage capsid protein [Caulobacter sp. S45]|uniref:phage capsid protein n=1 Tax=Caulobacter sp. S45 TaxID=1641861 RepID=UPI001576F2F1|nr:phage capsid protein [Caulobacter sp. S45]
MADPTGATALSQYVPAFRANLNLVPQVTRPRLMMAVDTDLAYDTPGDRWNADDVGVSNPQPVVARVPVTPNHFIDQFRRIGMFTPYADAPWLADNVDKLREIEDPSSEMMKAVMAGLARCRDDRIIAGALGVYYYQDNTGALQVGPANANVIAANDPTAQEAENIQAVQNATTGGYGLTVGKLINTKAFLDASELDEMDPGDKPSDYYIAVTTNQLKNLLMSIPVASNFYNDARALMNGTISYFMGFNFIRMGSASRSNPLPKVGYTRQCFAFHRRAIQYRGRTIINARIDERPDMSYRKQAYYELDHGCLRHYDEGVIRVDCDETTNGAFT